MSNRSVRLAYLVIVVSLVASGLLALGLARGRAATQTTCTDLPANISAPSITGTPAVGATLTGHVGSWDDGGCPPITYTVTWFWGGTSLRGPITLTGGATTDNYVVQASDQGHSIVFQVVARNSRGTTTAQSPPVTIPGPPPPPPPPAAITLTRTADGVSIYQNLEGRYYISDTCHTSGTSTDPGKTIGPAYIYRVDFQGQELVAPIASTPTYPPTGLGVFIADLYEGNPNDTPFMYDDGSWYQGQGAFESVQGNVCQGDPNNGPFTHGTGVSGSSVDARGAETQAPDGSYLWVHYSVNFSDPFGRQFAVWYWYRFYAREVDLWTKVTACPDGACHHDSRGPAVYIKMPKFASTVSGPPMDYQAESCYDVSGNWLSDATNLIFPNGGTSGNHCAFDNRGRLDIYSSRHPYPRFKLTGRSQPVATFGPDQPTYAWERAGYGLDNWADAGQNRTHITYNLSLKQDSQCGGSPGSPVRSWQDNMRRWEMGGDDPSAPGGQHFWPYKTIFAFFKGWEDGNGPNSCRSLFNSMSAGESYASFFEVQHPAS